MRKRTRHDADNGRRRGRIARLVEESSSDEEEAESPRDRAAWVNKTKSAKLRTVSGKPIAQPDSPYHQELQDLKKQVLQVIQEKINSSPSPNSRSDRRKSTGKSKIDPSKTKCYRCQEMGHMAAGCTAPAPVSAAINSPNAVRQVQTPAENSDMSENSDGLSQ